MSLSSLRQAKGTTQRDVAAKAQMDQGDISRLETLTSYDDCKVSTLRRYLEAIGGKLELIAAFPLGHRIEVKPSQVKETDDE